MGAGGGGGAGSLIEFLCTYGSLALYHGPWPLVYMRRVVGVAGPILF